MTLARNGRVVLENKPRDIMLPYEESYVFRYARYVTPAIQENSIRCCEAPTSKGKSTFTREIAKLHSHLAGYELEIMDNEKRLKYRTVSRLFDVIRDCQMIYAHAELPGILAQLGISSVAVIFRPEELSIPSTGEKVGMEIQAMNSAWGRTAAFQKPVTIKGKPYFLEVKGANCGDSEILRGLTFDGNKEPPGAVLEYRVRHSVEMSRVLEQAGYDSELIIAAYLMPESPSDMRRMGAYVRAVKATPTLAHYHNALCDVASGLGISRMDLAEHIIRGCARDLAIVWKSGLCHNGPLHEQNLRLGSVTDFTGSTLVSDTGFPGIANDVATFVFTCEQVAHKLIGEYVDFPDPMLESTDPDRYSRLCMRAIKYQYHDYAKYAVFAREIISYELNSCLGLSLPAVQGTASLAANIYQMQQDLGYRYAGKKHAISQSDWHKGQVPLEFEDLI